MIDDTAQRLDRQLDFIIEIDKLKQVLRQTAILGGERRENSAEHSWHIAVMALTLAEYAGDAIDILRVVRMLLIHDLVEIDAGDTFCYDAQANLSKAAREQAAADRIFGLLPYGQGQELYLLWQEFEAGETAEACFANALDRFQPLLHNYHNQGGTWRAHGITRDMVLRRMAPVQEGAPRLWSYVLEIVEASCTAGYIL